MSNPEGQLKLSKSEIQSLSSRGYRVLKKINEGAFAKVYRSEYKRSKQDVPIPLACKIMDISLAPPEFVRKFLPREIDALIRLRHPYLVHTHSIFLRRNKYFIFMRYMEHGDLLEYIMHKGVVPEAQARLWFRQLSLAVQYMHMLEMAHRDIKCENVLLTANRNAKLSDFGFCRSCVDKNKVSVVSATFCGSLSYTAPEIVSGRQYYPKPTDIWSLGIVLYVMLNKDLPFSQTVTKALYKAQMAKNWKWKKPYTASEACKRLLYDLLDPLIETRPKINDVVNSSWFRVDSRFQKLMPHENEAFNSARRIMGLDPVKTATESLSSSSSSEINPIEVDNPSSISQDKAGTSNAAKPARNYNKEPCSPEQKNFYAVERHNAMLPIKSEVTANIVTTTIQESSTRQPRSDKPVVPKPSPLNIEQTSSAEVQAALKDDWRDDVEDVSSQQNPSSSRTDNSKLSTRTYLVNTNNSIKPHKVESTKEPPSNSSKEKITETNIPSLPNKVINKALTLSAQESNSSQLDVVNNTRVLIKPQSNDRGQLNVINEDVILSFKPPVKTEIDNFTGTSAEAIVIEQEVASVTYNAEKKDAFTETDNAKVRDLANLYITSTTT